MKEQKRVPKLRFAEFPEKWKSVIFGDIATFTKGKNISKSDIVDDGQTECIRYGELYTDYNEIIEEIVSKTNLPKDELVLSKINDVIIPSSGETQLDIATASCVLKNGVALGGDLNIVRTKQDGLFISYYLNSVKKKDIASLAQGNSVVHLYNHQLKGLKLNLPNLKEQQKIASFLSSADKKITQLQQKKGLLEDYKRGVMQQIFSYQLRFTKEDGSAYPDWKKCKLKEVADIKRGAGSQYLNYVKEKSRGIRLIRIGDFLGTTDPVYVEDTNDLERFRLNKDDILIAGTGATAGITFKVPNKFIGLAFSYNAPRIRTNKACSDYIVYFLKSDIILRQQKKLFAGNAQPFLDTNAIGNFKILLPSIEEQTQIANFLSALDTKIALVQTQIENTQQFKKGLLQQMFV